MVKSNSKLKVIFFDLDDTLYDSTGMTQRARTEACDAMINAGLPAKSSREAYERLVKIVKRYGSNDAKHFNKLCQSYKVRNNAHIIAAGIIAYHNQKISGLHLFPGVTNMLMDFVKKELKLGIITNGRAIKQWDKILRLNIKDYFNVILVSDNKKQSKTKRDMIRKALKSFKAKPQEALFVGDRLDSDISAANKEGLTSVRFMHGKHSRVKPRRKHEIPDHKIKKIIELIGIVLRRL